MADYHVVELAKGPGWDHSRGRRFIVMGGGDLLTVHSIRPWSVWLRAPEAP